MLLAGRISATDRPVPVGQDRQDDMLRVKLALCSRRHRVAEVVSMDGRSAWSQCSACNRPR